MGFDVYGRFGLFLEHRIDLVDIPYLPTYLNVTESYVLM